MPSAGPSKPKVRWHAPDESLQARAPRNASRHPRAVLDGQLDTLYLLLGPRTSDILRRAVNKERRAPNLSVSVRVHEVRVYQAELRTVLLPLPPG